MFPPYHIFTFKHYMLDLILKIVEWRLQDEGVNNFSQLGIFVIFQRVDCPEHKMSPPGYSLQPHLQATAAPRLWPQRTRRSPGPRRGRSQVTEVRASSRRLLSDSSGCEVESAKPR